ncbi:DUF2591 family protein [Enterobacter kobei]|nr:DUF2591 family protein [Enterobacter kobei]
MDYSQLHDAQINMMVCKALGLELSSYARILRQDDATILLSDNETLVDYCNNPADAWPIIDKYRISIINLGEDEWGARGVADCKSKRAIHENSLRAAMIVFLMMQDAKHA